jgi:hypothetical protein
MKQELLKFQSIDEVLRARQTVQDNIYTYKKEHAACDDEDRKSRLDAMIAANSTILLKIDMVTQTAINNEFDELAQTQQLNIDLTSFDPHIMQVMLNTVNKKALGTGNERQPDAIQSEIDFEKPVKTITIETKPLVEVEDAVVITTTSLDELLKIKKHDNISEYIQQVLNIAKFQEIANKMLIVIRAQKQYQNQKSEKIITDVIFKEMQCEGACKESFWKWVTDAVVNPIREENNPVKALLNVKQTMPILSEKEAKNIVWFAFNEIMPGTNEEKIKQFCKSTNKVFETTSVESIAKDDPTVDLLLTMYGANVNIDKKIASLLELSDMTGKFVSRTKTVPVTSNDTETVKKDSKEKTEFEKHRPDRDKKNYVEKGCIKHVYTSAEQLKKLAENVNSKFGKIK